MRNQNKNKVSPEQVEEIIKDSKILEIISKPSNNVRPGFPRTIVVDDMLKSSNGIVKRMCLRYGFKRILANNVIWTNPNRQRLAWERLNDPNAQGFRTNHFPGMRAAASKHKLTEFMNVMKKRYPDEYRFYPPSWNISDQRELADFKRHYNPEKTYILKPSFGLCGGGILLVQSIKEAVEYVNNYKTDMLVAQEYIPNPALIDGFKFDIRVYVLVTDLWPVRAYVFRDGLVRLATQKYEAPAGENLDKSYMHLTNFSVNKKNPEKKGAGPPSPLPKLTRFNMQKEKKLILEGHGYKRSISATIPRLGLSPEEFWGRVDDVVMKTMRGLKDSLREHYEATFKTTGGPSKCFHLIGFDILMDSNFQEFHLLEINQIPSMYCRSSQLDEFIKEGVFRQTLRLIGLLPKEGSIYRKNPQRFNQVDGEEYGEWSDDDYDDLHDDEHFSYSCLEVESTDEEQEDEE